MATSTLVIIGAGPKAMAVLSKTATLVELGFNVPEIFLIENHSIGALWKEDSGYTTGHLRLGTLPEKDVGFPYASSIWGDGYNERINQIMLSYSWTSFLIEKRYYAVWIDRGRPAPEHHLFAEYLEWVFRKVERSKVNLHLIKGSFSELSFADQTKKRWKVSIKTSNEKLREIECDGIVLTGPGEIKKPLNLPQDPRILDIETFWPFLKENPTPLLKGDWAIVGNGETAACAAVLLGKREPPLHIDIITSTAMNYSRGESFAENHMYTDPFKGNWPELTLNDRYTFIERTDRGVFSLATKRELDQMEHIDIIPGWFHDVEIDSKNQLIMRLEYSNHIEQRRYDYILLSIGFDPLLFLTNRLKGETLEEILNKGKIKSWSIPEIEGVIDEDLSIAKLIPKLHLPMLAALQQGPGFPNLSCLGRLSDQILSSYVDLSSGSNLWR